MKKCSQCGKEIPEEIKLESGRTLYVAVVPFKDGDKEVYLCSDECVKAYHIKSHD